MKGNSHAIKKALQTVAVPSSKVGGDKRDRTADLLNAISSHKSFKYIDFTHPIALYGLF